MISLRLKFLFSALCSFYCAEPLRLLTQLKIALTETDQTAKPIAIHTSMSPCVLSTPKVSNMYNGIVFVYVCMCVRASVLQRFAAING